MVRDIFLLHKMSGAKNTVATLQIGTIGKMMTILSAYARPEWTRHLQWRDVCVWQKEG